MQYGGRGIPYSTGWGPIVGNAAVPPLARRVPCLHSWLVRSLPARPRRCKVAAFRCSPLRSLFRVDGTAW
jgi:hypothetical protein